MRGDRGNFFLCARRSNPRGASPYLRLCHERCLLSPSRPRPPPRYLAPVMPSATSRSNPTPREATGALPRLDCVVAR